LLSARNNPNIVGLCDALIGKLSANYVPRLDWQFISSLLPYASRGEFS